MPELTPQAFVEKWQKSKLSERSAAQQHFLDLCQMLDQPTPAEADPEGDFYTFEKGVNKVGSGKGFADVWKRGYFAFEYKGKHKDLTAAYKQLQLYREDLESPPLLVVSDMERFEIHTNFDRSVKKVYSFSNAELPREENLATLRALFTDPDSLKPGRTSESVTEEAAGKFARLAEGLRSRGHEPHQAAHFLNRLLFCLFAEDVGLLPSGLFTRIVERTARDPQLFAQYVGELFGAMESGGNFLLENISPFNGGLFSSTEALPLEPGELRLLTEAAHLDWGSVEPAIFGTLFERSLDPSHRAKLGAHYTSREDILAIVEPVLMAPLRREWEEVKASAAAEAAKVSELSGRKAENALGRAEKRLYGFAERLRGVTVLDPACGSGNFLYVSLRQLLDLEKEVLTFAGSIGLTPFFPGVSPEQLRGIELSPYAHELAQVSIWIGYLQWMVDNGFGARRDPVLGPMTNIVEMDAVIARGEDGARHEPEWPEVDVIVGNPPFLGDKKMWAELGGDYVQELRELYAGRVPGGADLVTYWFERAREAVEDGCASRVGLLATNTVRGGANRRVLERVRESGDIFFAESDRPWTLDGAAVRVSMVGFDDGSEANKTLDSAPAENIYADLTGSIDLYSAKPLPENSGIAFIGTQKGGAFDLSPEVAREMLAASGNPNGRPNSDVVKPWINGLDVTRRPRGMWIIDFGVDMPEVEAALYEAPFEYVNANIKPYRTATKSEERTADRWWLHQRPRPEMRQGLSDLERFLVTTRHAKHRIFDWFAPTTLPDSALIAFAFEDDYSLGVLHSRAHELWSIRLGTFLGKGNDPRYTPTTCFETFPFPEPTEAQHAEISEAARRLDELRTNWLHPEGATNAELKKRTLTNLYNDRPTWLAQIHERLDKAVIEAYGWLHDISDEEILKNLLALNFARREDVV